MAGIVTHGIVKRKESGKVNMKKFVFVLTLSLLVPVRNASAQQAPDFLISNIVSLVDVDINSTNYYDILPMRSWSTPGGAFLGLLRSFISNNCEDYLFHMSPEARIRLCGTADIGNIPSAYRTSFEQTPADTNIVIKSIEGVFTNGTEFLLSALIEETSRFEHYGERIWNVQLVCTNSQWKIQRTY